MSVSGLCELCQQPDVESSCDRCGRLVCDDHFDAELGYCVECAIEVGRPGESQQQRSGDDLPDGVDTYRF
jgi:hypothetical protein